MRRSSDGRVSSARSRRRSRHAGATVIDGGGKHAAARADRRARTRARPRRAERCRPTCAAARHRRTASGACASTCAAESDRIAGSSVVAGTRCCGRKVASRLRAISTRWSAIVPPSLARVDGHATWVNSAALKRRRHHGIDAGPAGRTDRARRYRPGDRRAGRYSGSSSIEQHIPAATDAEVKRAARSPRCTRLPHSA